MAGNQADSSKMKRLESALIQSKSEIQSLYVKIEELEKEKVPLITIDFYHVQRPFSITAALHAKVFFSPFLLTNF